MLTSSLLRIPQMLGIVVRLQATSCASSFIQKSGWVKRKKFWETSICYQDFSGKTQTVLRPCLPHAALYQQQDTCVALLWRLKRSCWSFQAVIHLCGWGWNESLMTVPSSSFFSRLLFVKWYRGSLVYSLPLCKPSLLICFLSSSLKLPVRRRRKA